MAAPLPNTDGMSDLSRISPDNWVHDQALLDRPGNNDIQLDMFYDYRTNLPLYPAVQAYFRKHKPPMLIVWGKNDYIFPADGAYPYKRDLPDVEFHLINTGHFALEDKADEMVPLIRDFLQRNLLREELARAWMSSGPFVNVADPIGQGFVAGMAHPGGNVTGFTSFEFSTGGKWVEVLKEISPSLVRIVVIYNPATAPYFPLFFRSIEAAAPSFTVKPIVAPVYDAAEIEPVIATAAQELNSGLIVVPSAFMTTHRELIIGAAARDRLPAVYGYSYYAASGGLVSYGFRRARPISAGGILCRSHFEGRQAR